MATRFWLQRPKIDHEESKQTILLIYTIMERTYFRYNNQYFKPQMYHHRIPPFWKNSRILPRSN